MFGSKQTEKQKRAEAKFRAFHARQFDLVASYMEKAVLERTAPFGHLILRGIPMSPFMEIGSETAPCSLALVNRLGCSGIAADISLESLTAIDAYRKRLGLARNPLRVCCDLHSIPLLRNSVPLVVSWGTLHHFPDPRPVVAEVRRVLGHGGLLFMREEPVRRLLSLGLASTYSVNRMGSVQRALLRLRLLPWIARIDGREAMDWGAVEMKFGVGRWRRILDDFEKAEFVFSPYLTGDLRSVSEIVWRIFVAVLGEARASRVVTSLFGGSLGGEAYKRPEMPMLSVEANTGDRKNKGVILVLRKPRGADSLTLRWTGIPSDVSISYRIYGEPVQANAGNVPGEHVLGLSGPAVEATVLDVAVEPLPSEAVLAAAFYSGPEGNGVIPLESPKRPEIRDPRESLACPSCVAVSETCRPDLCGLPCVSACTEHAIRQKDGRVVVDPEACTGCLACFSVCPLEAVDRSPLRDHEHGLRCTACGRTYARTDGVYVLLQDDLRRSLGY